MLQFLVPLVGVGVLLAALVKPSSSNKKTPATPEDTKTPSSTSSSLETRERLKEMDPSAMAKALQKRSAKKRSENARARRSSRNDGHREDVDDEAGDRSAGEGGA